MDEKTKKVRINVHVPAELAQAITEKAKELGMSQTGLATLSVHFGFEAVKMATDPQLKDYFEKQIKGLDYGSEKTS